jgi:diphthine synthase
MGISLRDLEEVKTADQVFLENYTSLLPNFSIRRFIEISGKEPKVVSRKDLEEKDGKSVLEAARSGKVALLIPGDPLIATTHVALRILAEKCGIETSIIHGVSILSAAIGLSGLQNYKFGKSVTVPFPDETPSKTAYEVIVQNKELGLHTLCLLDVKVEERRYLSIRDSLDALLAEGEERRERTVTKRTLVVGIARAGSSNPTVKAGFAEDILSYDFGDPPYSLIFPGRLHFMEAEALVVLAGAPEDLVVAK